VLVVVLALVAFLYVLVVAFYNSEGTNKVTGGIGPTTESGLLITVEPIAVNPLTGQVTVDLSMGWQGDEMVDADGHLRENTRVTINSSVGTQEAKFIAGDSLGRLETTMGIDGEQANYPFDVHTGGLTFTADTYKKAPDGSIQSTGPLVIGVQSTGGVSGWDTTSELGDGLSEFQGMDLTFDRYLRLPLGDRHGGCCGEAERHRLDEPDRRRPLCRECSPRGLALERVESGFESCRVSRGER
jgi:hypothetical protein